MSSATAASTQHHTRAASSPSAAATSAAATTTTTTVAAAAAAVSSSPLEVYVAACRTQGCRSNSDVLKLLSTTTTSSSCKTFDTILELDFSRNIVGLASFQPLLEVVRRCSNLRSLLLPGNSIDNERVCSLCDAVEKHEHLRMLNLSANPISDVGGKRIVRLLSSCASSALAVDVSATLMNNGLARRIAAAAPPPPAAPQQPVPCSSSSSFSSPPLSMGAASPAQVQQCLGTLGALPSESSSSSSGEEDLEEQQQQQQHEREFGDAEHHDHHSSSKFYALEAVWAVAAQEAGGEVEAAKASPSTGLPCVIACTREEEKKQQQQQQQQQQLLMSNGGVPGEAN